MFGNRKYPVKVKTLIVSGEKIIRTPVNLKLNIQELILYEGSFEQIFNQLRPLLDESSFPLRSIEFESKGVEDLEDLNHEVIKTAEKLFVKYRDDAQDMIRACWDLPNQRVIIELKYSSVEDYIELIQKWKEADRPIGTHYSFIIIDRNPKEIYDSLKKDVIKKDKRWIVIPFTDQANLKISRSSEELTFKVVRLPDVPVVTGKVKKSKKKSKPLANEQ
uniref:FTH domain-containing protein n=1 Tax=Caenorhabditis tropicalis TaxID=1561998 RepID=A0A1I7TAF3_9PELO